MNYKMKIILYTKHACERCEALKSFLNKYKIQFTEKDIDTDEVVAELVRSTYIIEHFCDDQKCIVITPIVKMNGSWMAGEFFNDDGSLSESNVKKLLHIET